MLPQWSFAWGGPACHADFKQHYEDFVVEEQLGFDPEGSGEHVFLYIEKRGSNTAWLADRLASFAEVPSVAVGASGLKDRQAVTRQWFSVAVHPSKEPDWHGLDDENLKVIKVCRHPRKLKRGVHQGNKFAIRLRHLKGDRAKLEQQLEAIKKHGFPNYFGEQRFGHQGKNIVMAEDMFKGKRVKRQQRSFYLSAARSLLFNTHLSRRVEQGTWLKSLCGEVFMLAGTQSLFDGLQDVTANQNRIDEIDIHPTGPLWGRGKLRSAMEVFEIEQLLAESHPLFCDGLEKAGLSQERRAMRDMPLAFSFDWNGDDLQLEFDLSRGAYATALLREIVIWSEFGAT